jgi:uncharacterized integral membrane protein (TIGR00698 family)
MVIFVGALAVASVTRPDDFGWDAPAPAPLSAAEKQAGKKQESPWQPALKGWIGKLSTWKRDPLAAFRPKPKKTDKPSAAADAAPATGAEADRPAAAEAGDKAVGNPQIENPGLYQWEGILGAFLATLVIGLIAGALQRKTAREQMAFVPAFIVLFILTVLSFVLAAHEVLEAANLEFALWALLVGLLVANTVGTPRWLEPAVHSELYIKIGLVLLGAEVLFSRLLALGLPGVLTSWLVTPVVLIGTYIFGQKILKMQSKSLNLVISADMSVCGVSAAIATAAACKAKKEELSLAVGLSLIFTVVMMVIQPMVIEYFHISPVVGGAWLGGTIDSTGAVAAAAHSKYLGAIGLETAVTVKMIQNILIGVTAICVAVYWTRWVEPSEQGGAVKVGAGEIWRRFPKFVIGFVAASLLASVLFASSYFGELWVGSAVDGITKQVRTWLFGLAFVCIGLETNFRQLLPYLRSGKPLALYLCGQALNLALSLLMASLMFGWLFPPEAGAP